MLRSLSLLLVIAILAMIMASTAACGPAESQASSDRDSGASRRGLSPRPAPAAAVRTATAPSPAAAPAREIPEWVKARVQAKIDQMVADYQKLMSYEQTVRAQIERFDVQKRRPWAPGRDADRAWSSLLGRYLASEPRNPFSPDRVASHVHVVHKPGVDGSALNPKDAGWVWNATDRALYAASDSAAMRACAREIERRFRREKARPLLGPKLQTLRAQLSFFTVYEGAPWRPGEVEARQWEPLIEKGYLAYPPTNPLAPREVSTYLAEVREPGLTGTAVDPTSAGWVWNSADEKIYAAGFDGSL